MVFTPEPQIAPKPFTRPPEPQPEPVVREPEPVAAPEPELEPVNTLTVLVYRAPGAKAGKGPAPTFEVRDLAPAPAGPDVDLAGAERAEGSAPPETIDLTDAVTDGADEDETTRRPEQ